MTSTLVIGFDSAWSGNNSGAIVGVLKQGNGSYEPLGDPLPVNFDEATTQINEWKNKHHPATTLILIDQPIIVENKTGQRPVENIAGSPVGKRYGGVQPANRGKVNMFGEGAPIWNFLHDHHACIDPTKFTQSQPATWVIETYPVLTLIALNWLLDDDHPNPRKTGRLPKYNPANINFMLDDWKFVCGKTANAFMQIRLRHLAKWIKAAKDNLFRVHATREERKQLQDGLDACLCLLVGLHLIEGLECLMVGNMKSGYMVVPYEKPLYQELEDLCNETNRKPSSDWLRQFKIR